MENDKCNCNCNDGECCCYRKGEIVSRKEIASKLREWANTFNNEEKKSAILFVSDDVESGKLSDDSVWWPFILMVYNTFNPNN